MLALLDLDGTLVDRDAGFARSASQLAHDHTLDAEAVAWLHANDQAVKERGAFFAALTARHPTLGTAEALWADYRRSMPHLTAAARPVVVRAAARN